MIILLAPNAAPSVLEAVKNVASSYEDIEVRTQVVQGKTCSITEVYLLGATEVVSSSAFKVLPGVAKVTRVSKKYRMIGRHSDDDACERFEYNGVTFDESRFHLFAGLCAVDNREHVEQTMKALQAQGLETCRMGAYKPRTSPYDFQGRGAACLPYVFELAGKYGIKVISMEVTSERHIEEIQTALKVSGQATGVMLQIGTRNAQNFELLKAVGEQQRMPVLFKRGMGITLDESLNAAEYIAANGNPKIIFCLRGVKSHLGNPHRNLVDFAHVPVVRRQTRLLVCIDPSHSVGNAARGHDGILDMVHALGQGIVAGAHLGLVDVHPHPQVALCDGPQAIKLPELPRLKAYCGLMRKAYEDATTLFS